ncbi:MAG TPA: response regulator [Geobacter sp.]|nr:MAG: two-component system response regulator [Geobacteraceae bacterium GWF2_54_21]HBA72908.1 response regulator [Geobacter sp.]HCE68793.1 response regulator [Geobacter sp.]
MNRTILIVEDNDNNRILMNDLLSYHGYTVLEANNGEEGIVMARNNMPDLILMDIQMPVMDGFAAAKILKDDPVTRQLRLIALTSFAMHGDRERILSAGFDDYIAKPIHTRGFLMIIKSYLEPGNNIN